MLTIDVKQMDQKLWVHNGTMMSGIHYSGPRIRNTDNGNNVTEKQSDLIFLACRGVHGYVGVMPAHVWDAFSSRSRRETDLNGIDAIPAWATPFMVALDDLPEALTRLIKLAKNSSSKYVNPTTGTLFPWWQLRPTVIPAGKPVVDIPTSKSLESSTMAILELWQLAWSVKDPKVEIAQNPIQPMLCDYLLRCPAVSEEWFRVEDKRGSENGLAIHSPGTKNPFHHTRQWHYLLCEFQIPQKRCHFIPRHMVEPDWQMADGAMLLEAVARFELPSVDDGAAFLEGIVKIVGETWEEVLRFTPPIDGIDLLGEEENRAKAKESDDDAEEEEPWSPQEVIEVDEERNGKGKGKQKQKQKPGQPGPQRGMTAQNERYRYRNSNLTWLHRPLNHAFAESGSMLLLPLDPGHAWGNAVVVQHDWTPSQVDELRRSEQLPYHLASRELLSRRCLVLRLEAMDPLSMRNGSLEYATGMRRRRYTGSRRPGCVFLISGVAPAGARYLRQQPNVFFIPSELLDCDEDPSVRSEDLSKAGYARDMPGMIGPANKAKQRKEIDLSHAMRGDIKNPSVFGVSVRDGASSDASALSNIHRFLYGGERKVGVHTVWYGGLGSFKPSDYHTTVAEVLQAYADGGRKYPILDGGPRLHSLT